MSAAKSRIVQGRGKVGTRSGVPALKKRTKRAVRHSAKQVLDQLDDETGEKAEAKLSDRTYLGLHPAPIAETRVVAKRTAKKTVKKKKAATPAATAAKKRAAEALQKELDSAARAKAERRAKRRAAARALKKARED